MVFLPQCHSTNDELIQMTRKYHEPEGTLVYTDDQQKGKGQRGNIWISEPEKNILMSVLLRPKFLLPVDQFYLNLVVGLSILDTLKSYLPGELHLKWPNDVYLNDKKISGVLIENNLKGNSLESAVVGIGINVNQRGYRINHATSFTLETNKEFERDGIIEELLCKLEKWYLKLKHGDKRNILHEYHRQLMWRGELHVFKANGIEFQGEIIGIDNQGRLSINENGSLRSFSIKEVEFIR
ncbi:MAG: biotin--[acetyl-CoA-carboxylase] ligase [Ekhidna sp.]